MLSILELRKEQLQKQLTLANKSHDLEKIAKIKERINEVMFIRTLNTRHPMLASNRNATIEEIARHLETKFYGTFGPDTINSFAIYIRGMKK